MSFFPKGASCIARRDRARGCDRLGRPAVFVRSTRFNSLISIAFVVSMGACGNFGGCGACGATGPLPPGGLPGNQTIEGGAQVRVTPSGFTKLTSLLPGLINSQLTANPIH